MHGERRDAGATRLAASEAERGLDPVAVVGGDRDGEAVERRRERLPRDPGVGRGDGAASLVRGRPRGEPPEERRQQPRLRRVEPPPEQLCAVALRGDALAGRREPASQLDGRDEVVEPRVDARLERGGGPLQDPGRDRRLRLRAEVRELDEVEELVRDGRVDAREAPPGARVEVVRHDGERAARCCGRGEGDAERPRREARDVDVRAGVGAGLVGERRPEASPLVVGERAVGRRADVLDVVGNPVRVVVVQRRRVDAEHDVVHHDPLARSRCAPATRSRCRPGSRPGRWRSARPGRRSGAAASPPQRRAPPTGAELLRVPPP